MIAKLLKDRSGSTAIEYALVAVLLSIGIVGSAALIGPELDGIFQQVASAFETEPRMAETP